MGTCRFSSGPTGRIATLSIFTVVFVLGAIYCHVQPSAAQILAAEIGHPQQPKKFHGRLPAYYGSVVNEAQRQGIYTIQKRYFPRIEELKAELESLTKKRDAEVAAVLSPQQQVEVDDLKAAAKSKRDAKKQKITKPATK